MILSNRPHLSLEIARTILFEKFGRQGALSALPSERDQNFRVAGSDGRGYVLKIANRSEHRSMLEAENAALARGAAAGVCPSVVPSTNGELVAESADYMVRLIALLPGKALGLVKRHSPALLADLGRSLGILSEALAGFDHPGAHRNFHWDLANAEQVIAEHFPKVVDPVALENVPKVLNVYREYAAPLLSGLRRSVVHNDANDFNVIVDTANERVSGVIDFGDMVFSHTVNEPGRRHRLCGVGRTRSVGRDGSRCWRVPSCVSAQRAGDRGAI